jgi:phosphonopyruvate decarboxylase
MDRYQQAVVDGLRAAKIDYFLYVPGTSLSPIIAAIANLEGVALMPLAREEEGMGIMGGLALGGKRPVLVIQDNGLGNSQNALTTFLQAYHISSLILSARRGGLNEVNAAMFHFTEHVPQVLEALHIKTFQMGREIPPEEWSRMMPLAYKHSFISHRPVVVLLELD